MTSKSSMVTKDFLSFPADGVVREAKQVIIPTRLGGAHRGGVSRRTFLPTGQLALSIH